MKKCKSCGAPLEGFMYNTIGKLMGVKPSENDPELCNKCAEKPAEETTEQAESSMPQQPVAEETTPEAEAPVQETPSEPETETSAPEAEEAAPAESTEEEKPEQNV